MKNLILTFLLLSVFTITSNAQSQIVEPQSALKSFKFVHKIQPLQLLQSNLKYAFEFSQNDRVSIELEGSFRPRQVIHIGQEEGYANFYGQMRYKIYSKNSVRKLTGKYFAPVISIGTAHYVSPGFSNSNILRPHVFPAQNEFLNVGLDYGYQQMVGRFVYDVFGGIGFSGLARERGVEYNNSHLSLYKVAFRLGFRVGFAHN